jgi:Holliday junction resolvase
MASKSGGRASRDKGARAERELVALHKALGIFAERYPLSGSSHFRGSGHDVDIYPFGRDEAPMVSESKSRKTGGGFVTLERWLGDYDILFLRKDRSEPLVLLPWRSWARLIASRRCEVSPNGPANILNALRTNGSVVGDGN